MHLEIHIALSYLATHLYNKLPRRRINLFTELLTNSLSNKYIGHWYPEQPQRGSAYRCLKASDPLIKTATMEANIAYGDVMESLPKDLCVWVDPGEVSYSEGGGVTRVLWKEGEAECGVGIGWGGVEEAAAWEWGSAGLEGPLIPPMAIPAPAPAPIAVPQPTPTPSGKKPALMTTAAFAQTKFGSTKLKSNTARRSHSNRMSPTEFSNYIKQKQREQQMQAQLQQPWAGWDPWQQQQPAQVQWSTAVGSNAGAGAPGQQQQGVVAN